MVGASNPAKKKRGQRPVTPAAKTMICGDHAEARDTSPVGYPALIAAQEMKLFELLAEKPADAREL